MKKSYQAKQILLIKALTSPSPTRFLLFGGAAGGGKTWIGCSWILLNCLQYRGTRWLIARKELKQLRLTTLKTLFGLLADLGFQAGSGFKYNQQLNVLSFPSSGSEIILSELAARPSDPDFASLGSLELTGAFIDEAGEIDFAAFDVVKSRVGRWKNKEYQLTPRILLTCNPVRNWLYKLFYKPWKDNALSAQYGFVQSLPTDNPALAPEYLEQLNTISDPVRKARLLHGDWDYTTENNQLFVYDKLIDMFTNQFVLSNSPLQRGLGGFELEHFITIDAARMGSDRAVIIRWEGFTVVDIFTYDTCGLDEIENKVIYLSNFHNIPRSNIICDEDGIGGGLVDSLRCKGFINNQRPLPYKGQDENYENLKTQCYYRFANRVNNNAVFILDRTWEKEIIEELNATRRDKIDSDAKLSMLKKEDIKRSLGRSPDFADALMMREWFELIPRRITVY